VVVEVLIFANTKNVFFSKTKIDAIDIDMLETLFCSGCDATTKHCDNYCCVCCM